MFIRGRVWVGREWIDRNLRDEKASLLRTILPPNMDGALLGVTVFLLAVGGNEVLRTDECSEVDSPVADARAQPDDLRSQLYPTVPDVVAACTTTHKRGDGRCDSCGATNESDYTYCRSCASRLVQ